MGQNVQESRDLATMQAQVNQLNQRTPFGNLTFSGPIDPSTGRRDPFNTTATTTLSPQMQRLFNQQMQGQRLMGQRGQQMLGAMPGANDPLFNMPAGANLGFGNPFRLNAADMASAGEGARGDVEAAQFGRMMSLMNPEFDRQEESMQQRLANQGLPQASRAYTAETGRFGDARNQATEQAALAAVLAGGQEQSRMVADMLGVSGAGFGQAMGQRQQVGNEQLAQRQIPFNEMMSLFNMGQQPGQQPQFFAPGQTQVQNMATQGSMPFGQQLALGGIGALGNIGAGWMMRN